MKLTHQRKSLVVPMNATSDVAFLLLIFIMVVSLINYRREIKIEYPEAVSAVQKVDAESNLNIWIDSNGATYIEGEMAELSDVENTLVEIYRSAPDTRIHIIADKNTAYKNINSVLEILQLLEYRVVSFVVKE
ncbi:biopolymer transporter ExbD [Spirochaetia bacterium]|nr:biopolymer transporter ExbD [Spirochaetia bacterium]